MKDPSKNSANEKRYGVRRDRQLAAYLSLMGVIRRGRRNSAGEPLKDSQGKPIREVVTSVNPLEDFICWFNRELDKRAAEKGEMPGTYYLTSSTEEGRKELGQIIGAIRRYSWNYRKLPDGRVVQVSLRDGLAYVGKVAVPEGTQCIDFPEMPGLDPSELETIDLLSEDMAIDTSSATDLESEEVMDATVEPNEPPGDDATTDNPVASAAGAGTSERAAEPVAAGLTLGSQPAEAVPEVRIPTMIRGRVEKDGTAIGTGRRKTAVARVRLKKGSGKIVVNDRPFEEYFPVERQRLMIEATLQVTEMMGKVDIFVRATGGGVNGQAGAMILGIARAIQALEPEKHGVLSDHGFLTRDDRMVERKKYGHKKARRSFQFSKR